jgi:hypothetical protein
MKTHRLAGALLSAFLSACGGAPREDLVVGGVYSVKDGIRFSAVKILALDHDVVHLRLYKTS